MSRTKIFVESIPLVSDKPSGISHALAGLVGALANDPEVTKRYEIVLVAPKRGLHFLDRWPELKSCTRQGLPLRMRIIQGLMRVHLLPPMDLLLGRGVYLFGNYMNWRVTKKSLSFTYIHDIAFALHPEFVSPPLQRMLISKVPGFIKQTNYVVTVSDSSKKEIMEYFHVPEDKILVLYNAVNDKLFRPDIRQQQVDEVRKRYGITKPYFMFMSNIEPRKNVKKLVEAFADFQKDYGLVLVGGDGWLNEPIFAEIDKRRREGAEVVKPKTFVPDEDVAVLMRGAVALVHPALHEGFGITPIEAMAVGTPAVVSDIPALREVVGEAGIYCDPNDTASIAAAMQEVLNLSREQRQKLIEKGILEAGRFSWHESAETFTAFLDKTNWGNKS